MSLFPANWFRKTQLQQPTVQEIEEINDGSYRGTGTDNPSADTGGNTIDPTGTTSAIMSYYALRPTLYYGTTANPGASVAKKPARDLETVEQDQPVRAYKGIRFNTDGARLWVISHQRETDLEPGGQHAKCLWNPVGSYTRVEAHEVPGVNCSCGWYAWKDRGKVEPGGCGLIVAEVDLYGKIIDCELGYRAEYQRVLSIQVERLCRRGFLCDSEAEVLNFGKSGNAKPSCREHASKTRSLSLAQVSGRCGLEIRWF